MNAAPFRLHRKQTEAWLKKRQFLFVVTGLQAGKTTFGSLWLMREIAKDPYADYVLVANNHAILTSGTMLKFDEMSPPGVFKFHPDRAKYYYKIDQGLSHLLPEFEKFHGTKRFANDPRRGHIFVRTASHPNSIVSMTAKAAWFDEAGDSPVQAWHNLQGRVKIHKGRVLCTSTPYSFNWLKDAVELAQRGEPTYDYVNFPSSDNPVFAQEDFEQARRTYPREDFERLYLGLFTRPENAVYDAFNADQMMISEDEYREYKKLDPVVVTIAGVDWGWNDPFVIIPINIHASGLYAIVDEFYESKVSPEKQLDVAKQYAQKYNIKYFYADGARPEFVDQFNRTKWVYRGKEYRLRTVGVTKRQRSRIQTYTEESIHSCRTLMLENKFRVLHHCNNTKRELGSYRWKTTTDVSGRKSFLPTPEGFDDHAMDAMRYAIDTHLFTKPTIEVARDIPDDLLSKWRAGMLKNPSKTDYQIFSQDGLGG